MICISVFWKICERRIVLFVSLLAINRLRTMLLVWQVPNCSNQVVSPCCRMHDLHERN